MSDSQRDDLESSGTPQRSDWRLRLRIIAAVALFSLFVYLIAPGRLIDKSSWWFTVVVLVIFCSASVYFLKSYREPRLDSLSILRRYWAWVALGSGTVATLYPALNTISSSLDKVVMSIAIGLGVVSVCAYLLFAWRLAVSVEQLETRDAPGSSTDEYLKLANGIKVSPRQTEVFRSLLSTGAARSGSIIERISERVESTRTSLRVTTSMTLRFPANGNGEAMVIPIGFHLRGVLIDEMELTIDGARASSLAWSESVTYVIAVLRDLFRQAGPGLVDSYSGDIERRVIEIVKSSVPVEHDVVSSLVSDIKKIAPKTKSAILAVNSAAIIVKALATQYPICVVINSNKKSPTFGGSVDLGGAHRMPLSVARSSAPVAQRDVRVDTISGCRRVRASYSYTEPSKVDKYVSGPKVLRLGVSFVTALFGLRPPIIRRDMSNSRRVDSYHLLIVGEPGSFVKRQRINYIGDSPDNLGNMPFTVTRRRGQDVAHVYKSAKYESHLVPHFEVTFGERPPGSVAVAALSSVGALLSVAAAAVISMGLASAGGTVPVSALLALPALIGTWSGLSQTQSLPTSSVGSRVSTIVTIVMSLAALMLFTLTHHWDHGDAKGLFERAGLSPWALILSITVINSICAVAGWALQSAIYHQFSRSVEARPSRVTIAGPGSASKEDEP